MLLLGSAGFVVLSDFIWQSHCKTIIELSNGVVTVLLLVLYHWKQRPLPPVLKHMKSILPSSGITPSLHVVVKAVLNVPHQQLETMAMQRLTEPAVLQLLF